MACCWREREGGREGGGFGGSIDRSRPRGFAGERAEREDRASVKSRLGVRGERKTGGRDGKGEEGRAQLAPSRGARRAGVPFWWMRWKRGWGERRARLIAMRRIGGGEGWTGTHKESGGLLGKARDHPAARRYPPVGGRFAEGCYGRAGCCCVDFAGWRRAPCHGGAQAKEDSPHFVYESVLAMGACACPPCFAFRCALRISEVDGLVFLPIHVRAIEGAGSSLAKGAVLAVAVYCARQH